jgi:hypothetical protein
MWQSMSSLVIDSECDRVINKFGVVKWQVCRVLVDPALGWPVVGNPDVQDDGGGVNGASLPTSEMIGAALAPQLVTIGIW